MQQVVLLGVPAPLEETIALIEEITTEGTWLVGLLCSECITPVPLFLSIVEVN